MAWCRPFSGSAKLANRAFPRTLRQNPLLSRFLNRSPEGPKLNGLDHFARPLPTDTYLGISLAL